MNVFETQNLAKLISRKIWYLSTQHLDIDLPNLKKLFSRNMSVETKNSSISTLCQGSSLLIKSLFDSVVEFPLIRYFRDIKSFLRT